MRDQVRKLDKGCYGGRADFRKRRLFTLSLVGSLKVIYYLSKFLLISKLGVEKDSI